MNNSIPPSRPRGRREQQKQATREVLLSAAQTRFGKYGFAGTRLEDIARDAGTFPATLYLHFPTKSALVLELSNTLHSIGVDYYERLRVVATDPTDSAITDWVSTTLETWTATAPMASFIEEAAASDEAIREAHTDILNIGINALIDGLTDSATNISKSEARERALVAMSLHHGLFREYQRGSIDNLDDLMPLVSRMWATALRDT